MQSAKRVYLHPDNESLTITATKCSAMKTPGPSCLSFFARKTIVYEIFLVNLSAISFTHNKIQTYNIYK